MRGLWSVALVMATTFVPFGTARAQFVGVPKPASIVVTVTKSDQHMIVIVDGKPRFKWSVSTGARGYATPSGHYKVSWLDEHHKSKQYNDAPMPYAIFFDEGKAIHGFAGNVGGPASHGCVRLSTGNAKTLFRLVEQLQGLTGFKYDTTIIVR
jgi:lipoprotein-anchoring transpeptidase ErfK/SrfK